MIMAYRGIRPQVADSAFLAPTATVVGDVHVGDDAGIWFGVILRGDVNRIRIGRRTNLQDGTIDPAAFARSTDIWSLMGTPNPARFTTYGNPAQVDTCPNAYTYLAARLPAEVAHARSILAFQLNPTLEPAAALTAIDAQIEQAYYKTKIATAAQGAADLLRRARLDRLKCIVYGGGPMYVSDAKAAKFWRGQYLGGTREAIAREKAGIFRAGRPAVVAEPDPPAPLIEHAAQVGAPLYLIERDFALMAANGMNAVRIPHTMPDERAQQSRAIAGRAAVCPGGRPDPARPGAVHHRIHEADERD